MIHTFPKKVWDAFMGVDLAGARVTVAIGSLVWAVVLLFMGPQFDRPAYRYLAPLAPQWAWGAAFGVVGVLQFFRSLRKVPITQGYYTCVVSGLIAWLWCHVAASLWLALTPPPAIVAGNVALAIMSGVVFIRTVARRE